MDAATRHRLEQQVEFLVEADKLRTILRRTRLIHADRHENDAEHCWYLTLMALTFAEYAPESLDLLRTLKMLILHDLVEIDAGDTFAYDTVAVQTQREREQRAADRLFALLPEEQRMEFRALWEEFEAQETPEARFAAALDRFGGMLPNYYNKGGTWREMQVTIERVKQRNRPIGNGSPVLWEYAEGLIDDAAAKGWLPDTEE